jgi:hypothetical protein
METTKKQSNSPEARNENLTCWRAATSPQCLRVETALEIHLLPYGYFQHAVFSRKGNDDCLLVLFVGTSLHIKGKRLDTLVDAMARLGVEQMNVRPAKYVINNSESVITEIEVSKTGDAKPNGIKPDDNS